MDAWALTDHGNANGHAHAFNKASDINAKGIDFKFIPGVEFYFHPDLKQWQLDHQAAQAKRADMGDDEDNNASTVENEEETKQTKWFDPVKRRHHLIVLAKNRKGLENLYTLVTRAYDEGFYRFPRIDLDMLKTHAEGLVVSTACLHPNAKIRTSIGILQISELVRRINTGEIIEVMSYLHNEARQAFRRVTWGDVTRRNAQLVKIKLKDGRELTLTPDHRVYTDHGWLEAAQLSQHPGIKILAIKRIINT